MQLIERLYERQTLSLTVIVLLLSGCSGSGSSSSDTPASIDTGGVSIADTNESDSNFAQPSVPLADTTESSDAAQPSADVTAMEDASAGFIEDDSAATQSTPDIAVTPEPESEPEFQSDLEVNPTTNPQADTQADPQADSASLLTTRVDFEIMVPAYMSNQLQIDMTWGSREIAVQWVGDESWFASEELPTNARLPLTIQFSDLSGDVVLGVHEADFQTGTNASEIYAITAEDFNTQVWDDDNDGISNLSESIAGTNPLIVEGPALEVRDIYFDDGGFSVVLANVDRHESKLTVLPFFEQLTEEKIDHYEDEPYTSRVLAIDVDDTGTGTFDDQNRERVGRGDTTTVNYFATRTNTGNSINYVTTRSWWNTGAAVGENSRVTSETQAVDSRTRLQTAELFNSESRGNRFSEDIVYSLTGTIVEGSANCEASHGALSHQHTNFFVGGEERVINISKAVDDQYWYVAKTTPNGGVEEEYFVQNLGRNFHCDLTGL